MTRPNIDLRDGHHLHSYGAGLHLIGRCWTGLAGACCLGRCRSRQKTTSVLMPQRRPWRNTTSLRYSIPIRAANLLRGTSSRSDEPGDQDQHGRQGGLARQRLRGAALAGHQVRRGVPAGLHLHLALSKLLQRPASSLIA